MQGFLISYNRTVYLCESLKYFPIIIHPYRLRSFFYFFHLVVYNGQSFQLISFLFLSCFFLHFFFKVKKDCNLYLTNFLSENHLKLFFICWGTFIITFSTPFPLHNQDSALRNDFLFLSNQTTFLLC